MKNKKNPHYQVTAGIIKDENRLLISQRMDNDHLGGLWEFPGGKLEQGESLEECLIREVLEELNIQISIQKYLFEVEHHYKNKTITLHIFLCCHQNGTPECREVQNWKWIDFSDISDYQFPDADEEVIRRLGEYFLF